MSKQYLDNIPNSNNPEYTKMSSGFVEELEKLGEVKEKEEIKCECDCPPPPPPTPPVPPKKKPIKMTANLAHTLDDLRDKYIEVHYIYVYGTSGKLNKEDLDSINETKANYIVLNDIEIFELNSNDEVNHRNVYNDILTDGQVGLKEIIVDTESGYWTSRYIELDVANKQNLGYIQLDKYLLDTQNGVITDEYDLSQLNVYLINKVSINNNIYYLTLSNESILIYFCTSIIAPLNQITLTRSNGHFHLEKVKSGVTDHRELSNLDYLSSGHLGFAGIEFGTTAQWNSRPDYRPVEGMIVVYTDYSTDSEGNPVYGIKIGDGNAYLKDKTFIGGDIASALSQHIENNLIHVSAEDRQRWDNKLNYEKPTAPGTEDLLILNRN